MKKYILIVLLTLFGLFSLKDNYIEKIPFGNKVNFNNLNVPDNLLTNLNNQYNNVRSDLNKTNPDLINKNNIDQNWYASVVENISQEEYNITYSKDLKTYQSPNRANNIRFIYHKDGFTAKPKETRIPLFDVNDRMLKESENKYVNVEDWFVVLKLKNKEWKTDDGEFSISKNKAKIENDNMIVDYTNTKEGMRQDFIVKKKPDANKNLELLINAFTDLKLSVNKEAVEFISENRELKMLYSSLKAWDAKGKKLDAYFEKRSDKQFAITVNDKDADYPVTVDPISSVPDWSYDLPAINYALSVSSAGDVNLDGYSDIIIGNPDLNKIYLFYGSSSGPSHSPDWTYISSSNDKFGFSVSGASDINGDNFSDVITGTPYYSNGEINEGRVCVFYGSPSGLSNSPDWVYEGNKEYAETGYSVSTAGDFNDDGFDDVIIGSPGYQTREMPDAYGRVSIFLSSQTGLSNIPDYIYENYHDETGMGNVVSCAGDVNGDGLSDVLISQPYWPPPADKTGNDLESYGSATVIYGGSGSWTGYGESTHALYGYSISSAGDVNNDGFSDVIIGSPNYSGENGIKGKTYLYFGSLSGIQNSPVWTKSINANGFGRSVSSGDFNSDGFSDVLIGEHITYWDLPDDTSEANAYVYFGSASGLDENFDWRYNLNETNYTIVVSNAGDVNGDGYSDILIGSKYKERNTGYKGNISKIFYGGNSVNSLLPCWRTYDNGYVVSGAGDVNGDGFDDVIIGSPVYSNGETEEGIVKAYYGSNSGLPVIPDWSAESNTENAGFGYSVSGAGDVNNDGFSDIVIGAPGAEKAFVYLGSSTGLLNSSNWTGNTYEAGKKYGISVSNAGDVNGDSYSDIVIGTEPYQNYNGQNTGAFVYGGSASGISGQTPLWTAVNNLPTGVFGKNVSSAGDVNGDGFDDIIVSDFLARKVFAYYGSVNRGMSDPADWTAYESEFPLFGYSISDAGDVNGDGFGDIIISSTSNAYSFSKATVYYGSSIGLPSAYNWQHEFYQILETIVSSAGDFNNDGYDDIIIGDERSNGNPAAFLFFGSQSGIKNNYDPTFTLNFVHSISPTGDVNGDNIDDIIIGSLYPVQRVGVFCGSGNMVEYFQMTPKQIYITINSELCISAIVKNQYSAPMIGEEVKFIVRGVNPDSVSLFTDSLGTVKYCYIGNYLGYDTITGKAGNLTDKTIAIWDFPLPIELFSFSSSISEQDITLFWTTSSEQNNSGFDIERNTNNTGWIKAGFVKGSGTTNAPENYSFTDKNLVSGKYNYRLKQTDFNGNFEYFELPEEVSIGIPDKYDLSQNYP
ncbi:MAG: FG-GAP-like repeat-containing protein, partial [Ignavibacteria bacterium]